MWATGQKTTDIVASTLLLRLFMNCPDAVPLSITFESEQDNRIWAKWSIWVLSYTQNAVPRRIRRKTPIETPPYVFVPLFSVHCAAFLSSSKKEPFGNTVGKTKKPQIRSNSLKQSCSILYGTQGPVLNRIKGTEARSPRSKLANFLRHFTGISRNKQQNAT